jgi:glycine cleavage system H protein
MPFPRAKGRPVPTEDLRYTAEHEWVQVLGSEPDARLRVGITDYAQESLGDIVFVTMPVVGTELTEGQALGEVESTKSVSDVYAPVAGRVTARNEQLESSPELINADPLGAGWLIEMVPTAGVESALVGTEWLDAATYAALVSES